MNHTGANAVDLSQYQVAPRSSVSIPAVIGALILISATLVFVAFAIVIYRRRIIAKSTGTVDYDSFHPSSTTRERAHSLPLPLPPPTAAIYHRPLADPPHRMSYQLHDPPVVQTSPRKNELGRLARRNSNGLGNGRSGSQYCGGLSKINEYATEELAERIHRRAREKGWPVVEQSAVLPVLRYTSAEYDTSSSTLPYLSSSNRHSVVLSTTTRTDTSGPPSYPLPPLPFFSHTPAPSHPRPQYHTEPSPRFPVANAYSLTSRPADEHDTTVDSIEHAIEQQFGLSSPAFPTHPAPGRRAEASGGPPIPLKNSITSIDVASAQIIFRSPTRQNQSGSLLPSPRLAHFDHQSISPGDSLTISQGSAMSDDARPLFPPTKNSLLSRFRSNNTLSGPTNSQHNLLSLSTLGISALAKRSAPPEEIRSRSTVQKSATNTDIFLATPRSRSQSVQYRIPSLIGVEGLDFSRLGFDSPSTTKRSDAQKEAAQEKEDYFGDFSRLASRTAIGKENAKLDSVDTRSRPVSNRYSDASEYDTPAFCPERSSR